MTTPNSTVNPRNSIDLWKDFTYHIQCDIFRLPQSTVLTIYHSRSFWIQIFVSMCRVNFSEISRLGRVGVRGS
jgi:hypothetical protein